MDGGKETCGTRGRSARNAPKGVTTVQSDETVLNVQKSVEVIVEMCLKK